MFECPVAKQSRTGSIIHHGAELKTEKNVPCYLFVAPDETVYVGVNPSATAVPFYLNTPKGTVEIERLGFGKVELFAGDADSLNIEGVSLTGRLSFYPYSSGMIVTVNGENIIGQGEIIRKNRLNRFEYVFNGR